MEQGLQKRSKSNCFQPRTPSSTFICNKYGHFKTSHISKPTSHAPVLRKKVVEDGLSLENGESHPGERSYLRDDIKVGLGRATLQVTWGAAHQKSSKKQVLLDKSLSLSVHKVLL